MAVFTEVPFTQAAALLSALSAGSLLRFNGIASGIENTNYFAVTTHGEYVVTVFERLGRSELPFYLGLMSHLAERGLPVPRPLTAADGMLLHTLAGKPAAVTVRLPGAPVLQPDRSDCERLGSALAQLHLAGADYPLTQPNPRGLVFWEANVPWLAQCLPEASGRLLREELAVQQQLATSFAYAGLPRGPIHADLFRDNVLFVDGELTGLLDFYFAGTDTWLYDLAVCLNDWCSEPDAALDPVRASALVAAYAALRPLREVELQLFPTLLRAAALRFWITRLVDVHRPRDARILQPHDPAQFERILSRRRAEPWQP